ncbi:hypothetical protein DWX93_05680 [Roseburia hominis]|uniref:Uncharacterized protein n=1 Tax=Roseburia hominis TaxID=301301 RepID=A0A395V8Q0_9FIRM|nr:hypothetical protein DWX93_05680 [Roseburia hominis]
MIRWHALRFQLKAAGGAFYNITCHRKEKCQCEVWKKHATLLHVFLIMLQFEKGLLQRNTETL